MESEAESTVALRRAAASGEGLPPHAAQLVEKIHNCAYKDIDEARVECSEDELFEVIVSASVGAARQRLLAGLRVAGEAK